MSQQSINIRPAAQIDLDAINCVIKSALMSWKLPERVKRLALPNYRYTEQDLSHLEMVLATDDNQDIIGIAAWERADTKDTPAGCTAMLLHGIYVTPSHHHHGVGRQLFKVAEQAASAYRYNGLLVKAQEDATGFFISQGMRKLHSADPSRHYVNRFWKSANE